METNNKQLTLSEFEIVILEGVMPWVQAFLNDLSKNKTSVEIVKLNKFLSGLAIQLQNSKEKIDLNYLATDEASEIFKRTIESAIQEEQQEKSQLFILFLINFIDVRFSSDSNKRQLFQALKKITFLQAGILRDATEWLVLAYDRDTVSQSTDYTPANIEQTYAGYILESFLAIFAQKKVEDFAPQLDSMVEIEVFASANNGDAIQHFGQKGRGFKPTKLGLQLLEYLGISLSKMPEKKDFLKK